MNTNELVEYVKAEKFDIEDFDGMNLKTKRAAVIEALEDAEDDDTEEDGE